MSDRGDWDPWDFGDPEGEPWEEPTQAATAPVHPYGPGAWEEDERPGPDGPPRGALAAALCVMLVLAVGIAAVVLRGDDGGDTDEASSEVETDDEERSTTSSSTSSTSSTSTSTSTTVVPGEEGRGPDEPAASSTTARRSTPATTRSGGVAVTTTVPGDDGEVPGCGAGGGGAATPPSGDWASRWTSQPGPNRHMTLSICAEDVTPRAGQPVTFYVKADDPDAPIAADDCGLRVEWTGRVDDVCYAVALPSDGPQPPPEPVPGRRYLTVTHVFGSPGPVTVAAVAHSAAAPDQRGPYADDAVARLSITVLQ
jgi:hypothetical protein